MFEEELAALERLAELAEGDGEYDNGGVSSGGGDDVATEPVCIKILRKKK